MALSEAFILNRLQKTVAVALTISPGWEWETKTAAELSTFKSGVEAAVDDAVAEEVIALAKRGELDGALDALGKQTLLGVGLARNKWGKDPAKKALISRLSAQGNSRVTQRKEAEVLAKTWGELDPAWVPVPGPTLAAYQAARTVIEGNDKAVPPTLGLVDFYENANGKWRGKAEMANAQLREATALSVGWYDAATIVFAPGTANGDLIRGQIPTTYDPMHEPLPVPGTPTGVAAGPGDAEGKVEVVCLPSSFAVFYQITVLDVNGLPVGPFEQSMQNQFHLTGLSHGDTLTISMVAGNASGVSAPSAPISVTVP